MKRFFQGPLIIILTVLLAGGAVVWAYQYKKAQKVLSYESSVETKSTLVAADFKISDAEWKKLLDQVNTKTVATTTSEENLTNSDTVSREILARLIVANQLGKNVDKEMADKIVKDIMLYANSVDLPLKQYNIQDIKVSSDNAVSAQIYKESLTRNITQAGIQNMGNELVIMEQVLQSNNMANIDKLSTISAEYSKIAAKLLTIAAPAPIAKDHLDLVNFYMRVSKTVKAFAVVKTDPLIASMNFGDYTAANAKFDTILKKINMYLSSVGLQS